MPTIDPCYFEEEIGDILLPFTTGLLSYGFSKTHKLCLNLSKFLARYSQLNPSVLYLVRIPMHSGFSPAP